MSWKTVRRAAPGGLWKCVLKRTGEAVERHTKRFISGSLVWFYPSLVLSSGSHAFWKNLKKVRRSLGWPALCSTASKKTPCPTCPSSWSCSRKHLKRPLDSSGCVFSDPPSASRSSSLQFSILLFFSFTFSCCSSMNEWINEWENSRAVLLDACCLSWWWWDEGVDFSKDSTSTVRFLQGTLCPRRVWADQKKKHS